MKRANDKQKPNLEYLVVLVAPGMGIEVTPLTAETGGIADGASTNGLAWVINELARIGFRLLEGTVLQTDGAGRIDGTFFMWRERRHE